METDRQGGLSEKANQKVLGQLIEIMDQRRKGILTDEHLQALIEHRNSFPEIEYPDLDFARKALGEEKVISAGTSVTVWNVGLGLGLENIRYSKATLRWAAKQNKKGADWRLVFCNGLSLCEQHEKRSTDLRQQPCFHNNDLLLKSVKDSWVIYKFQAGYYLINFHGQFGGLNWNQQEQEIVKLGKEYERCHEAVFSEAILTIFMVNGERIAEDWWHWGLSLDFTGVRVDVGFLDADGLKVRSHWHGNANQDLRVCVLRKFDF